MDSEWRTANRQRPEPSLFATRHSLLATAKGASMTDVPAQPAVRSRSIIAGTVATLVALCAVIPYALVGWWWRGAAGAIAGAGVCRSCGGGSGKKANGEGGEKRGGGTPRGPRRNYSPFATRYSPSRRAMNFASDNTAGIAPGILAAI